MRSTISDGVNRLLSRYPYIEEYLSKGVINFRALARYIYDDLKREFGSEVKFQSVVTAVRRYPISRAKRGSDKVSNILAGSEVNLKYDVGVITTKFDQSVLEVLGDIQAGLKSPYMVFQGIETLTVVVKEDQMEAIASKLGGKVVGEKDKLAFVIVNSPEGIVETPGVISYLGNILALEGINLVEMMSSHTETCFIVEENDALQTIDAIRSEIIRARSKGETAPN